MSRLPFLAALALAAALAAGCTSPTESCTSPSIRCGDRCVDGGSDPTNCGACGLVCAPGTACCSSRCVDVTASDPANCGACGHRCPRGATCSAGACECPASLPSACGAAPGECVDLAIDPDHCGTCGHACGAPGVAGGDATCAAGACACQGGATDCGGAGGTPPCVNLQVDRANCGSCGHACTSRATCAAGACVCGAAAYPDDCGSAGSPVCVDRATDPANCGACGHACPGGAPSCQGGLCCASGESNCSGACVDTRTSVAHCGACGRACAAGQTCASGACGCGGTTPLACGTRCCAGTACCAGNTCQTRHTNGLGGTFHDCSPPYSASNPWTQAAAEAAAASWSATGTTYAGICDGQCVARQTSGACAIWCYGLSPHAGEVTSIASVSCTAACNNFYGNVSVGPWQ